MLTASEALARLLPPAVLAAPPPEHRADPRQVMWQIYKQMRERGEINLKPLPPEDHFQHRIAELEAENAALKSEKHSPGARQMLCNDAAPGSAPALLDVPMVVERVLSIDPSEGDITPPNEIGVAYVGTKPGPDDPPLPRVIEGRVVPKPPAASAAPPSRQPTWDDSAGGKAWQAWVDAGGAHYDRWGNHNE
jgi:hypothetical protein